MRIALTGSAGYIGAHLALALASRGHEVHAQDRRHAPVPRGDAPWESHAVFDLHDPAPRRAWLRALRPDAVVHLAALYGRVWGEDDPGATARDNAGLTAAIARDTAEAGSRLVLVSSSEVYGASACRGPVDETSPLEPLNMYGLSKKWSEEAARLYAPDGLAVTRLNMPYGPPAFPPPPGEVPETSGRPGIAGYNVLHSMLWQAARGLPLAVHQGTERCLTWIGDTAAGIAMVAESGQAGTWNVCRDDDNRPVAELAALARDLAGGTAETREEPPPAGVTTRKRISSARLAALGWKPSVPLEDGARLAWEHFSRYDAEGRWPG